MSTQISKRELFSKHALSAGLGVGALALLAQRASADTPFTTFPFTATGAPTPRTMPDRLGEIKNVKDYGAVGDGVTDDTAAIQACFDATFGTWASPHGGDGANGAPIWSNKPIFFPMGKYKVSSAIGSRPFTAAASDGGSPQRIILTCDTSGLSDYDNINVIVASGNMQAHGSFFIQVIDSMHLKLLWSEWIGSSPGSGKTATGTFSTPCLRIRALSGGYIYGAGRQTMIRAETSGAAVLTTRGCAYTRFENLAFDARPGGICLQIDGLLGDPDARHVNVQQNTVMNCCFGGTSPAYGAKLGAGQTMGETTQFFHCLFIGCVTAGLSVHNLNAVNNGVYGGNFSQCGKAIWCAYGSIPVIHGASFQDNKTDIWIDTGVDDGYSISGCRTESLNFIHQGATMPISINGCNTVIQGSGFFFDGSGFVTINSCSSVNGYISGNAYLTINSCNFQRPDYLTAKADNFGALNIHPQRVTTQSRTSYTLRGADGSSRIKFTSASPITVTVPKNSDNSAWRLIAGNWVEIQQYGTGQVTLVGVSGVTLHGARGLKTRAQYSVIRLMVDATGGDSFTIDGDAAI